MSLGAPIAAELKQESISTRKMLERIPEQSFGWKPHEKSMTLGRLAGHVAELPGLFVPAMELDELDFASSDYKPFQPTTVAEVLDAFDKNIREAIALVEKQSDEHLLKKWRMRSGDHVILELPRIAAARSMALNHMIHHRGQLSVYLRLLNVPLPSVYGPTADEKMF
jgi:uncharacterized damage-inducible protein DinB